MSKRNQKITLRTFTEELERVLASHSPDGLREILRAMARDVPSGGRQEFLGKLLRAKPLVPPNSTHLVGDAVALRQAVESRSREEPDWDSLHDEDDHVGPFVEFVGPLSAMFDQAEAEFDFGNFSVARQTYEQLFAVFSIEDEYSRGIRPYDVEGTDIAEARARYLRAIYLTEDRGSRAQSVLTAMEKLSDPSMGEKPRLQEMLDIATDSLQEFDEFLNDWVKLVGPQFSRRSDAWLREAVTLSAGAEGLEALARSEGMIRPRAYLDWVTALLTQGKWDKAIQAIETSLAEVPADKPIRAALADLLTQCGERGGDANQVERGRWLSFEAKPTFPKLVTIYEATKPQRRADNMRRAASIIEEHLARPRSSPSESWESDGVETPSHPDRSLLLHAFLLGGDEDRAFALAQREEPVGWSSGDNPQGFFVAYTFAKAGALPLPSLPSTLRSLWDETLDRSSHDAWSFGDSDQASIRQRLEQAYTELISAKAGERGEKLNWCLAVAERRIDQIVGNKHRRSYGKAALLTAACADVLRIIGKPDASGQFFAKIKTRFPRHVAFQQELRHITN